MAQETILTKERLGYYDSKLKAWVTDADSKVLADAKQYFDDNADQFDPAGTAQTKVDELANGQVKTNKEAIEKLNGDSTVDGSVDKKVADAINTFATQISDDGTINTYKEILNYISTHGGEAAEMTAAIDALETLVGDKSVATQIAEAITAENLSQYATDEELANAIARIVVLEGKSHEHVNKALLDTYTQTEANLADAVAKKHAHDNEDVLNGITSEKVSAWDNAEENAKKYANEEIAKTNANVTTNTGDITTMKGQIAALEAGTYDDTEVRGLITTNVEDIDKLEASLAEGGATANAIADAKKAGTDAQSEVDALEEKVGAVTEGKTVVQMIADAQTAATYDDTDVKADISANADAISALEEKVGDGYAVIAEADIDAMFA